jgi:hypothetical protein
VHHPASSKPEPVEDLIGDNPTGLNLLNSQLRPSNDQHFTFSRNQSQLHLSLSCHHADLLEQDYFEQMKMR